MSSERKDVPGEPSDASNQSNEDLTGNQTRFENSVIDSHARPNSNSTPPSRSPRVRRAAAVQARDLLLAQSLDQT